VTATIIEAGKKVMAAWRWLPVLVRAPVVAFLVLNIGTTAGVLPLFGNMRLLPGVPWALPVTLIVMAAFWYYFTGGGYPAATRAVRQDVTRLKSLPWPIWRAAVFPLLFSLVTVTSLRLALPSILPIEAPRMIIDLRAYPLATVIGLLLSLAVSAGIAEEVAFRGYMQKPLEDSYGIVPALILTGIAFWFAHADKVTFSHLPFHLVASIVLGLAAHLTKSLLPAIIGHVAGDALLLPAYVFRKPAFIWSALAARPVWEGNGAETLGEQIRLIWQSISPFRLFESRPGQTFAILVWVFIASGVLTFVAFVGLARATRRAPAAIAGAQSSNANRRIPRA
jgi:membrane protease YdiL (CAAX protease family)